METETKDRTDLGDCGVTVRRGYAAAVVLRDTDGEMILLEQDGLRELVQWAYDQFGILAAPSYDLDADRAPDPLAMIHEHVNAAHAQQAVNRGRCRCGMAGCSDRGKQ